ncbi:hypothetical protein THAR02_06626 [Trichoderma harzianum]|uniref:Uncharacterized protein n=1 Tax=Trichoderma harzianum TaxID=5544 RepID=A0A0F9XLN0_TRIHA|nr:hypothetical protein THAR02_06626 [Trichoderma harzianum]
MGATVVNSVGTGACKTPIANVDLSDKLENNVLWGDNDILFHYSTFDAGDYISGNTAFDLAVDYSHLTDGALDDDETKISIQLLLMNQGDVVQNQEIEKFPTKDGTGPFTIKWSPDEGRYTAFSIAVNLISDSLAFDSPKIALDNIAWDHFRVDGEGNIDDGNDKTTTSAPDTTTVGNSTTRPPSSHTETSALATTSAPSRTNTTSSTFVFPSPTRTTEVQSSTSTGLAQTSAPTLFGFVAVLAAGAAFL